MQITKTNDHVLLKNNKGEYHLSIEQFDKLGQESAIEFATKEINKKINSDYSNKSISLDQARELGFCQYGIEDFCKQLDLDINESYTIEYLFSKITLDIFFEYTSELSKLFGKDNIVQKFGGIKSILENNRTQKVLNFVLKGGFIPDKTLHLLACDFAERTLSNFEDTYPDDNRPRRAIEVKRLWIGEEYKDEQVS